VRWRTQQCAAEAHPKALGVNTAPLAYVGVQTMHDLTLML